jgi:hypothetical protein
VTAQAPSAVTIRSMHDDDWPAVQRIYREGIATGSSAKPQRAGSLVLIERRSPAI